MTTDIWCATNEPERPTLEQYATYAYEDKVDMTVHNSFGTANCGWKP